MQPFSRTRKLQPRLNFFIRILLVAVLSVLFLCAYWYISNQFDGNIRKSPKFYIYPWDQEVTNSWPSQFTHHRLSIGQEFQQNHGAGPLVDEVSGMYHTHQYSLFTLVLQRLLESEHRTLNPAEATLFFIPYDLGMDASTRSSDGGLVQTNCPKVKSVMDLLHNSPYFQRKQGSDHFLLHSINQMMVYYANEPCTRLYELCMNCTKISIDTYPPGVFTHLDTHPFMTHKWVSIPFPSNYHVSDTTSKFSWRGIAEYPQYMSTIYAMERPYELCFVGSAQVTAKLQRQLRLSLMETCRLMPHLCLLVSLKSHESHERPFEVVDGNNKMQVHNPYSLSRLCLTPGTFLRCNMTRCQPASCIAEVTHIIAILLSFRKRNRWGFSHKKGLLRCDALGLRAGHFRAHRRSHPVAAALAHSSSQCTHTAPTRAQRSIGRDQRGGYK